MTYRSEYEEQRLRELLSGRGMLTVGVVMDAKKRAKEEARTIAAVAVKKGKAKPPVYWCGEIGPHDDMGNPIGDTFVDGATGRGWAIMSPSTHRMYGRGLGTGLGQKYERQADGKWLKVEG